jgi:hypothetical protein
MSSSSYLQLEDPFRGLDRCILPGAWACTRPVSLYTQQLHIILTHIHTTLSAAPHIP